MANAVHNRARQIRKDSPVFAYTSPRSALVVAGLDDSLMYAPFIISTLDEDRENDVIEPKACLDYLHEYKSNPIVLFDHEQHEAIGSSEGPDHKLHFDVRKNDIAAGCFFHDCLWKNVPIGQEVYHLVRNRIFRGASIGFLPIQSHKRGRSGGTHYSKIRLTEWSICPLQSNQNALAEFRDELRASLDRGEVVNKSFASSLRQAYLPAAPVWSNGALIMSKRKKAALVFEKKHFSTRHEAATRLAALGHTPTGDAQDGGETWIFPVADGFDGSFDAEQDITKGVKALLVKKVKPPVDDEEDEEPEVDETPDEVPAEDPPAESEEEEPVDDEDSEIEPTGDEPVADEENSEPADYGMKPGAHTLAEHLAHHEAMVGAHDDRTSKNDSDKIQALLEESKQMAESYMAKIHALAKELYPGIDLDGMADAYRPPAEEAAPEEEPEAPEPEPEPIVKKIKPGKLKAAKNFLEDLDGNSKVHTSLHAGCRMHAKCLGEHMKDMDGGEEEEGEDDDPMVEKRIAEKLKAFEEGEERIAARFAKLENASK